MEWKDLLNFVLLAGVMLLMMKFGGCCGGHKNKNNSQGPDSGCCEKNAGKDNMSSSKEK